MRISDWKFVMGLCKKESSVDKFTAIKCGACKRLYPCIAKKGKKVPYKAIFDWLEVNGYSVMCKKCTAK